MSTSPVADSAVARPAPKPGPRPGRSIALRSITRPIPSPRPVPVPSPAGPLPTTTDHAANGRPLVRTEAAWVVVDFENLAGTGDPGHGLITSTWESLRRVLLPGDKLVIATGALCSSPVRYLLTRTGARFLVRAGKNGAENALIENTDLAEIAKHYRWLVIASGDGRLTSLAEEAVARGMNVWQVTGIGRCHPSLEMASAVHSRLRITVPGRHAEARSA